MTGEGFHPDEELNIFVAAMSDEERTQFFADKKFQEEMSCDIIPGIGMVNLDPEMTDEQKAQAVDYLRWLKEDRAK